MAPEMPPAGPQPQGQGGGASRPGSPQGGPPPGRPRGPQPVPQAGPVPAFFGKKKASIKPNTTIGCSTALDQLFGGGGKLAPLPGMPEAKTRGGGKKLLIVLVVLVVLALGALGALYALTPHVRSGGKPATTESTP
ncbi:MAG: hypothetical protein ACYS9X_31315 [Planctomycetota bacterium]|jgi:hypothetical protein